MNIIISGIIGTACICGCVIASISTKKSKAKDILLEPLNNTDVSCGDAFKNLKLSNSIKGEW